MAFGSGYTPREAVKLEPGEYEAAIIGARYEQTKNGTPYLAVYVQVKGHKGCRPNSMAFYDRPYTGQKEMERWDEKMTEFFDAFHLPRKLTEDFNSWKYTGEGDKGRGWIRCVPQKSNPEYSNIYPLIKRADTAPSELPPEWDGDPSQDNGAPEQAFPEDIPF